MEILWTSNNFSPTAFGVPDGSIPFELDHHQVVFVDGDLEAEYHCCVGNSPEPRPRLSWQASLVGSYLLHLVELGRNEGADAGEAAGPTELRNFTFAEFHDWATIGREGGARGLGELRQEGLIETRRRLVRIFDLAELTRRVAGEPNS